MRRNDWLEGLRVLDLTNGGALLCGKIMADMGADVIAIDDPHGPWPGDEYPLSGSSVGQPPGLFWHTYNLGKRSITLSLETEEGRRLLRRLVSGADFVVESFQPGRLAGLNIGYDDLRQVNPRVILTSITPFGQEGPYRSYKGSDLVINALGGFLSLCGEPDRPPVRVAVPQAMLHAGAYGAAASLIAHHHRQQSGNGQHVDVSAQQCMTWAMQDGQTFWHANHVEMRRMGQNVFRPGSGVTMRVLWPCKDGHVVFWILLGPVGIGTMSRLTQWMREEGKPSPFMESQRWAEFEFVGGTQGIFTRIQEDVGAFFLDHSVQFLVEGARKRNILIAPVSSVHELANDEHLKSRGFWTDVHFPSLDHPIKYPGVFVRSVGAFSPAGPLPQRGQDNRAIFQEVLGLSDAEYAELQSEGAV